MKKLYKIFFIQVLITVFILYSKSGYAQCPNGQPAGGKAFDTTIRFASGVTYKQVKFPKFDPKSGMLSCVKMIVTMIGVVDTNSIENLVDAPITVVRSYDRKDTMVGPGLTPNINSAHLSSVSIPLAASNNVPNSGPDFYSSARDTVLKQQTTRTLTDSTSISAFYGTDSVVYDYYIKAKFDFSSSDVANYVRSSALVNFRFEYCTCPLSSLPVGLKNFTVAKRSASAAQLQWEAEAGTDTYTYEIEVSRDGSNFSKTAVVNKLQNTLTPSYQHGYAIKANEYGRYYFRVKQSWIDGYYKYSEVKPVDFSNPVFSSISIYPNPSSGQVGIKFVGVKRGNFLVQVSNVAGHVVMTKELLVAETDYKAIADLKTGMYYVKITDVATQAFCINQMVVK